MGARITNSYLRPGGVFMDAPTGFWLALDRELVDIVNTLDELEEYLSGNEIVFSRTKGTAVLAPELLINASITGPMLRASGVDWDLRRDGEEIYTVKNARVGLFRDIQYTDYPLRSEHSTGGKNKR